MDRLLELTLCKSREVLQGSDHAFGSTNPRFEHPELDKTRLAKRRGPRALLGSLLELPGLSLGASSAHFWASWAHFGLAKLVIRATEG